MTYFVRGLPISGKVVTAASAALIGKDGMTLNSVLEGVVISSGAAVTGHTGFIFAAGGVLKTVDASGGLPAGTIHHSGLPFSGGALCMDAIGAVTYCHNGIPFTAVGAVAAV